MSDMTAATVAKARLPVIGLGAGSGFAVWLLAEALQQDVLSPSLWLAAFAFVGSLCCGALAMIGPLPIHRALKGGGLLAVPMTGLLLLASLRFSVATDLLDGPALVLMAIALGGVSCSFLLMWLRGAQDWLSYDALSAASWGIAFRLGCGIAFVFVLWGLGLLSNALLGLVNITFLEDIADTDWLALTLSGAAFGLGLAVVQELGDGHAPELLFRLISLLLVPVFVVVGLFLLAIPFQGLSNAFGHLSSAATLMAMAGVIGTLICVVLYRFRQPRGLTGLTTRALAGALGLVAVLCIWAVMMRIFQYGWTPDRVYAAALAALVLLHGVTYAVVAVTGGVNWAAKLRRAVVALGLVTAAWLAILLSPLADAGRISAASQIARFNAGEIPAHELPLWEMAHDWGRAGQAALATLEAAAQAQGDGDLLERLEIARAADTRWEALAAREPNTADLAARLSALLPVRPAGQVIDADYFSEIEAFNLNRWISSCELVLQNGRRGCAAIVEPLGPLGVGEQVGGDTTLLVLVPPHDLTRLEFVPLTRRNGKTEAGYSITLGNSAHSAAGAAELLGTVQDGLYEVSPSRQMTLKLGEMEVLSQP